MSQGFRTTGDFRKLNFIYNLFYQGKVVLYEKDLVFLNETDIEQNKI